MYKPEEIQGLRSNNSESSIDLKPIFRALSEKWHWFLLCALAGLLIAFLYYSYAAPVFKINARVLVTDEQKGGGAAKGAGALMDLAGIMGSQNSVDNEVEILKTPDLIEKVVRLMNLNIVYGQVNKFKHRELYKVPFSLTIIQPIDTIQYNRLELKQVGLDKVHVTGDHLDKVIPWGQHFQVMGIGKVLLTKEIGLKMTDGTYFVDVTSVDKRVEALMANLSAEVSNNQVTIIDLSLNYPVEKKGEEILHAIIDKYQSSNLEDKNAIADSTYKFIKQRLYVIASELGDVETDVEKFKQRNKLVDMTEQGKLLVQNTSELTTELARTETQISVMTDLENYLRDETKNKRVFPTSLLPSDMVFTNLMQQYNSLLSERDKTLLSVTEATPFVQNLNSQIADLRKGILANIQSTKNTFVVTRSKIQSQLSQAQGQIKDVPQVEKNFIKLARNQQIKQELYIFLMQKAEETAIAKTSNMVVAKIIARPKANVNPVSPKRNVILFFGLFAGMLVPILVLVGRSLLVSTVTSRDDITGATRVPIVGEISHNRNQDNMIVAHDGRSAIAEQFRALRSNLAFYSKDKGRNAILLTSSMSGEGKSFTAINLGHVLAILGKKVVLVELDLRKPGLSNKLNIRNDVGFSSFAIDESLSVSDIIRPVDSTGNLSIVSSGPLPPNPGEILLSERTSLLLETLKNEFDYVIMDAPPVGIISDAESLVQFANITLYLVRQKVTKKQQLGIVNDLYLGGKIKNIGIVVNDVVEKDYGYGQGYGVYGHEQEKGNWLRRLLRK